MRTLLIDADSLVYEAAKANEIEIQWTDDLWTLHAHLEPAKAQLQDRVESLMKALNADRVVMALSDYTDPWRKRVMPTYKANRKATRKPVIFAPLREFVHATYTTFQRPGLEGDDVLGILLTHPVFVPGEKVVVSIDKDMKTLPGQHYRLHKQEEFEITKGEADYWHLMQTLTGDTTDGYPGCPGVGPVSAEKMLAPFTNDEYESFDVKAAWPVIVAAYTKAKLSEAIALQNARVARICRHTDYDFKKKEVVLWEPPK